MLENEKRYSGNDIYAMLSEQEVKEAGGYFAICENGMAYYAAFSLESGMTSSYLPQGMKLLGYIKIEKEKRLEYLGCDSWGRPVYRDEDGYIWKDTDCRREWQSALCSATDNDVEGEPEWPMKLSIRCDFIPYRITD